MIATQQLTKKQLRELESELHAERARLERSRERNGTGDAGPGLTVDAVASIPRTEEGGVALSVATRAHARYAAVLDALARLGAGSYGVCVGCSGNIAYGRLLVMPETTRCVACGPRL